MSETLTVKWDDESTTEFRQDAEGFWEYNSSGEWYDAEAFPSIGAVLDALLAEKRDKGKWERAWKGEHEEHLRTIIKRQRIEDELAAEKRKREEAETRESKLIDGIDTVTTLNAALRKRVEELESAVKWALSDGAEYHRKKSLDSTALWRLEFRKRAYPNG